MCQSEILTDWIKMPLVAFHILIWFDLTSQEIVDALAGKPELIQIEETEIVLSWCKQTIRYLVSFVFMLIVR